MQETQEPWVQPVGWEDSLEWKMTTHSSILARKIPWMSLVGLSPQDHKESDTTEQLNIYT